MQNIFCPRNNSARARQRLRTWRRNDGRAGGGGGISSFTHLPRTFLSYEPHTLTTPLVVASNATPSNFVPGMSNKGRLKGLEAQKNRRTRKKQRKLGNSCGLKEVQEPHLNQTSRLLDESNSRFASLLIPMLRFRGIPLLAIRTGQLKAEPSTTCDHPPAISTGGLRNLKTAVAWASIIHAMNCTPSHTWPDLARSPFCKSTTAKLQNAPWYRLPQ